MTTDQKRKFVMQYCSVTGCKRCCLKKETWLHDIKNPYGSCIHIYDADDAELDEAIQSIRDSKAEKKTVENSKDFDPVNRPAHYADSKIEVIDYIEDKKLGFCLGNAIKYISRAGKKDPDKEVEDLKKAIWYVERRIKELEEAK